MRNTEAMALVLLILFPVLLWIAYKLDYIHSEKKKKKYDMALKKLRIVEEIERHAKNWGKFPKNSSLSLMQ